jgi:hypothetical protein
MKRECLFVGALLAAAITPHGALAQEGAVRTAAISHLKVSVVLSLTSSGRWMLVENFTTDDPNGHSVWCIFGARDMKYILRDSSGKNIPASGRAEPDAAFNAYQAMSGVSNYSENFCKAMHVEFQQRRILLDTLYPGLSPGTYTLQLILAPKDSSERAALAPLTFRMPP